MLGFDRERLERAGTAGDLVVPRRHDHMLERRRLPACLLEDLEHRHAPAAPQRRSGGDRRPRAGVDRRCATAGAAKPEKTGTWTAPMCAQACEAIAASGDIGR